AVGKHHEHIWCDPLRPAGDVRGAGGLYPAQLSALHTLTGPLGRSVDLKQPSMHRHLLICPLRFSTSKFKSTPSSGRSLGICANTPPSKRDGLWGVCTQFRTMSSEWTSEGSLTAWSVALLLY
ncbi:hypothetical protein THAOC_29267, partial [Thalassiosira oceanica]